MEDIKKNKKGILIALLAAGVIMLFNSAIDKTENNQVTEKEKKEWNPEHPVYNNPWDGSVNQVTDYLKANLNDWDSYESIEWSNVVQADDGKSFMVRHKYRAANKFGGKVIEHQMFEISPDGRILTVTSM